MEQDKVTKLSSQKNVWDEESERRGAVDQTQQKAGYRERWDKVRASKKVVFWAILGAIIITMIIGFSWGGWVTGGKAQTMGETMADDAVVQRLAPICLFQFNQDPDKAQKLVEFNEARTYQRDDYVKEQGWATMPGEDQPDSQVADACAKLIAENKQ